MCRTGPSMNAVNNSMRYRRALPFLSNTTSRRKHSHIDRFAYSRYALGQVSGLVYVAASADGYVVGEELEGNYFEDW